MMFPLSEVGNVEPDGLLFGNPNFRIGYSRFLCSTEWDGETRTVRFSSLHPGDPLEVNGLSCTVKTILPAFGTWSAGIVQYQLPSQVPGEDPVAHWDASACSCDFGELTSMSAVQDIVLDYQLSVEAGGLVLREPALDVYFLSQIVQGGGTGISARRGPPDPEKAHHAAEGYVSRLCAGLSLSLCAWCGMDRYSRRNWAECPCMGRTSA